MRSARSCISIAAVALATASSACVLDELFSPELPADLTVEITGDTLLTVGDTVSLDVRVLSEGEVVDGVRLSFTSSRPTVAEITPDDRVAILARDTFSITAEIASGSLAGVPASVTATFRGVADRIVASVDTVLFSSLTATRQLNAAGVGTHNDPIPGIDIVWHSEVSSVVSVEPTTGLLTAVSNGGPVPVIAQADTRADTVRVVVRQRTGTIEITPGDAALRAAGDEIQFSAELLDSLDQSNTASDVSWSSTAAGIVTVDGNGLATAGTEGIANIIAVSDGVADTARVLVSRLMATLDVSSTTDTLFAIDETTQVSANGTDTDGNFVATPFVRWRSLNESTAVVDTLGVVSATGSGDALIVGESGGVEDTVVVTVHQIVTAVAISSPIADTTFTSLGDSATFVALAQDANGYEIPGTSFSWTAADTTIATVDADGNVRSRTVGTTRIDAAADGYVESINVTVAQWLASVDITPDSVNLAYGETVQLHAGGHDARGFEIPDVAFDWDSRDWGVASSDGDGWISPQGDGATYIVATSDGLSDSTFVRVGQLANVCDGGTAHESDISVDEIWTLADSPHCVGGSVSVIGGSRLTIEAGVTVKFTAGSILRLGRSDLPETGSLFAEGTPGEPILFTPFNNTGSRGQWQGVQLEWVGTDDSLVLRNVTIEYAGRDHSGTISNLHTFSGAMVIDRVTIRESQASGINLQNSGTATSTLIVDNSVIEDNQWSGIVLAEGVASITNTEITNNGGNGVRANWSGGSITLSGNRVQGNTYPLRLSSDLLGGITGQDIDSLLGNTNDTLIIECCGAISTSDTLRTSPKLPWRIDTDDLEFVDNTIWKIDAGTMFRITQGTQFTFNGGSLVADGDTAAIIFTSENQNPGDWGHLAFNSTTDTSRIHNVEFRYGGGGAHGTDGTLKVESGVLFPVILDDVSVKHSGSVGIRANGQTIVTGPVVADSNGGTGMRVRVPDISLVNSSFVGNATHGLWSSGDASGLSVLQSSLSDNGDWGAALSGNNTSIENSIVSGNTNGGLWIAAESPVIRGDTVETNGGVGLDVSNASNSLLENNLIADNVGLGALIHNGGTASGNRVRGNSYPLQITADVLSGLAGQHVDSMLGNTNDTLVITCCGSVTTTDTIVTGASLPWRVDNSEDIHFQNGAVWRIEAGATISVQNTSFYVDDGVVLAEGEVDAPILFTGFNQSAGDWGALTLNNGADTTRLNHVEFRHGGGRGHGASLEIWDGEIVLDDVMVLGSNSGGIRVGTPRYFTVRGPVVADSNNGVGMSLRTPNVTLANSRFVGNVSQGVYAHGSASDLTITRSQIVDNGNWGVDLHGPNMTVENSYIWSNTSGGIYIAGDSPVVRGDTVGSNTGRGVDVGDASNSTIENNLITDNTDYGARIQNSATVSGNRIRGNWYPLQISSDVLGGMGAQDLDSLLGNDADTLLVQCCGNVSSGDTVRTKPALPWRVDNAENIHFENGSVWRIDPGAMIISANTSYRVDDGVVLALGEAGNPIRFVGVDSTPGNWGALVFNNGPDTSRLSHVEFRYGDGRGDGSTLAIWDGEVVLDNVSVLYSGGNGIDVGTPRYFDVRGPVFADSNMGRGIDLQAPNVTISDSRFVGNQGRGFNSQSSAADLTILRTQIGDNGEWGAVMRGNNTLVEDSHIWNNTNGGIWGGGDSQIIRGDTIESNGGEGLDLGGASNALVENNLIADNADIGVELWNGATFHGNRVRGNLSPLQVTVDVLGRLTGQSIDDLLGNVGDTLYVECCGSIAATDTVRTRPELPWVVTNTTLDFIGNSVWKMEPGATVILDASWVNMGGGPLIADGQDQGILFTGRTDAPGSWGQLTLGATNDSSLLRNVTLRNGGGQGAEDALRVNWDLSHAAILDSVMVSHSQSDGIRIDGPTVVRRFLAADSSTGAGLRVQWDALDVPAGRFTNNSGWGVEVRDWNFSLDNADVGNNGLGGSSGGIGFWGGLSSVTNTWVHHNAGQGIYVSNDGSTHTFDGVTVEDNGSYGVELRDQDITFTNNIVRDNGLDGIYGDAGDEMVFGALSGNTVTGNGGYPLVLDPVSLQVLSTQNLSDLLGNTRDTLCICSGWSSADQANIWWDMTIESTLPWRVDRSLTVGDGATLTLNAGATMVMDGAGAGLWIGETGNDEQPGRLLSLGTEANPVLFTAADQADPWHVLAIVRQHDSSVVRHTTIEHGGNSGWAASFDISDQNGHSVLLDTVTVRNAPNNNGITISTQAYVNGLSAVDNAAGGLSIQGGTQTINGSRFERNGDAGIQIEGGSGHTIVQSILVDNINWGLFNNTGDLVTAINNWWGDASGPSGSGAGTGNAVSNSVTFNPWLLTPPTVP